MATAPRRHSSTQWGNSERVCCPTKLYGRVCDPPVLLRLRHTIIAASYLQSITLYPESALAQLPATVLVQG